MKGLRWVVLIALVLGLGDVAFGQEALDGVLPEGAPSALEEGRLSTAVEIALLLTVLSLLPAVLVTITSFTRIVIVLGILRTALGTQQTPSNQVLLGLALFMTLFIMRPREKVASCVGSLSLRRHCGISCENFAPILARA